MQEFDPKTKKKKLYWNVHFDYKTIISLKNNLKIYTFMEPKNYIHKFYKDASWSQSVMNKIMPKQNTSIQNNFWIIHMATN